MSKERERRTEAIRIVTSEIDTEPHRFLNLYPTSPRNCDHDDEWLDLQKLTAGAENFAGMLVRSSVMREVVAKVARLAQYRCTVLIEGESGTGKELVAHALHRLSSVSQGPYVIVNCSNLVPSLAEAQLFGHVRGAFTDARENSLGYFRAADGGTLFLDEIGELPLGLQPKLLRAVETHEIQPVGSSKSHKVDIRIVAATNRGLGAMTKSKEFRADLYFRLNTASIRIPPLRERSEALGALIAHFVECYNRLFEKQVNLISHRALMALSAMSWPGNIRELAGVVHSAVLYTDRDRLCVADFPHISEAESASVTGEPSMPGGQAAAAMLRSGGPENWSLREAEENAAKRALLRALRETGGNCNRAAELLGVSRYTVYRLVTRFGLNRRGSSGDLKSPY